MNKTRFSVDSATIFIIDPQYLGEFARHFSYKEFITYLINGGEAQDFVNEVTRVAFGQTKMQMIGVLEADGLLGDTEFVGDGEYELSSDAIKMTPQYQATFEAFITHNYSDNHHSKRKIQ